MTRKTIIIIWKWANITVLSTTWSDEIKTNLAWRGDVADMMGHFEKYYWLRAPGANKTSFYITGYSLFGASPGDWNGTFTTSTYQVRPMFCLTF